MDFIAYANSRVEKLQDEGRYDAAVKLKGYIKRFVAYLGRNEVPFKDFDSLLVRNYHAWLKNQELGRNTISLYIRNLKRVYRLAVDDGLATECHPFDGMDVSYRVKRKKDRNRLTPKARLDVLKAAVPFRAGLKWGLKVDERVVVPPIYRNIKNPVGCYCAMEDNPNRWGVIMVDGKVVIEARYTHVEIGGDGIARLTLLTGRTKTVDLRNCL